MNLQELILLLQEIEERRNDPHAKKPVRLFGVAQIFDMREPTKVPIKWEKVDDPH